MTPIKYSDLNSKQKEIYNFQKVAALLADYGFNCIKLAADNPPDRGELRIFNQFTETFSVNELASRVESVGGSLGINVEIKQIDNPRKEKEEHYYNPAHTGLLELGLEPNFLTDERLAEMIEFVSKYRDRTSSERIFRGVKWA